MKGERMKKLIVLALLLVVIMGVPATAGVPGCPACPSLPKIPPPPLPCDPIWFTQGACGGGTPVPPPALRSFRPLFKQAKPVARFICPVPPDYPPGSVCTYVHNFGCVWCNSTTRNVEISRR